MGMRLKVPMDAIGSAVSGLLDAARKTGQIVATMTFDVKSGFVLVFLKKAPANKGIKLEAKNMTRANFVKEYTKKLDATKRYKAGKAQSAAENLYKLAKAAESLNGTTGNVIVDLGNGVLFPTTAKNGMMMATHTDVNVIGNSKSKHEQTLDMADYLKEMGVVVA